MYAGFTDFMLVTLPLRSSVEICSSHKCRVRRTQTGSRQADRVTGMQFWRICRMKRLIDGNGSPVPSSAKVSWHGGETYHCPLSLDGIGFQARLCMQAESLGRERRCTTEALVDDLCQTAKSVLLFVQNCDST